MRSLTIGQIWREVGNPSRHFQLTNIERKDGRPRKVTMKREDGSEFNLNANRLTGKRGGYEKVTTP